MSHERRKPKETAPLPPRALGALRRRVEASNVSATARGLAVSDTLVARALRGEGVTLSMHRLLTLQLDAPDAPDAPDHSPDRDGVVAA